MYTPGLDAYFFPNLAVGQPSNNMDLSEIKIYLGMMIIIFFLQWKKITNREELWSSACLLFNFRITVSETYCHMINHWCSYLEVVFISVHFDWHHRDQEYISTDIKCTKIKKSWFRTLKEVECNRYTPPLSTSCHVIAVCLQEAKTYKKIISTFVKLSEIEI